MGACLRVLLCGLPLLGVASAQAQFSAAPVVFPATGDNSSQTQTVQVTVTSPTTIASITSPIPFNGNPDFTVLPQGGCSIDGTTVNPIGTVCSVLVRFRPVGAGVRTGTLLFTDGAGNGMAIGLSGVGYYPQIAITPAASRVVAGLGPGAAAATGDGGASILAALHAPEGIATDSFGNTYIADTGNNLVRMLDAFGNMTTVAGGGSLAAAAGEGQLATSVALNQPTWLATDSAGNLYITETGSNVVRRVAMSSSRKIALVAGNYTAGFTDNVAATAGQLSNPQGIVVDAAGNFYIADTGNHRLRRVDGTSGMISTFAGSGADGFDAGMVAAASLHLDLPVGLALDASGVLYVSDFGNHVVQKISGGMVTVVAGTATAGNTGDGGLATAAMLESPAGLAISPSGDLFIVDASAGVVRKVQSSDGVIETVLGDPRNAGGYSAGLQASTDVLLNGAVGIAFDRNLNLFVSESGNHLVRAISATPGELQFTSQNPGTSSGALPLRLSNIGNAALGLGGVTAANTVTSNNFVVTPSGTEACGTSLAAGAHCRYGVAFAPQANGFVLGQLNVVHVANNPNFNANEPVYLFGGAATVLAIGPAAFDPVVQGRALTATSTAAGGVGTITLDVEGVLPTGVSANVSGAVVTLTGTPTVAGSFPFTVFASDSLGTAVAKSYTLQVLPAVISTIVMEGIHITDAPTELPGLSVAVTETLHLTDTSSQIPGLQLTVTETLHLSDTPRPAPQMALNLAEVITVSDGLSELPSRSLTLSEVIHVTDAGTDFASRSLDLSEVISVSDGLQTFQNGKQNQSINAPTLVGVTYGNAPVSVSATATSGLPVSIVVKSGPAIFSNGKLSLTGGGQVTVTFAQSGDATYNTAPTIVRTLTVAPAPLTVTAASATRAFGVQNPIFQYTLTGFIGGDTTSFTGAPAVNTAATTNSPAGGYAISPTVGSFASSNYVLQTYVPGTLTITGHVAQTITFLAIPNVPVAAGPLTLTARSSSGLAITYTITGPATLAKNKLLLTGPGTVSVTAAQNGNATYDPAVSITRTFTVTP